MSETTPSTPPSASTEQSLTPEQRRTVIGVIVGLFIFIGLLGGAVFLMMQNPEKTTVIRDIFIIFMAVESLFIGLVLTVLMVQIARLTNLLQHEIKPILQNTNETVNTVRGTAVFISENLVDPVMKLNGYIAAIGKFFELINVVTKK